MRKYRKKDFPLADIRRYLEPGPIVLVSSAWRGETNIMTMGWHMMMGFEPALFACFIWDQNHSHALIKRSKQCVINLPTSEMLDTVVKIGNCSGADVNKFAEFGLTAMPGAKVDVPLIKECYANFECRLYDGLQIRKHNLFIWEVVKAHVATAPKAPETMHYLGEGKFRLLGRTISRRRLFKPEML